MRGHCLDMTSLICEQEVFSIRVLATHFHCVLDQLLLSTCCEEEGNSQQPCAILLNWQYVEKRYSPLPLSPSCAFGKLLIPFVRGFGMVKNGHRLH